MLLLRGGPVTEEDLAEAVRMDVHAMKFALKRLAHGKVIEPAWIDEEKAWRLANPRPTPAAPTTVDAGATGQDDDTTVAAEQEDDDGDEDVDGEIDPDVAVAEEAEPPAPEIPPLRSRDYPAGHRQPRTASSKGGNSWWLDKSRDALAREADQRADEMSRSREGQRLTSRPQANTWTADPVKPRDEEARTRREC